MQALAEQVKVMRSGPAERGGDHRPSPEALLAEELELHKRLCERDESALLEYLDRIGHVIYCAALADNADAAAADDVTEELFLALWQHPQGFSPANGPVALQLLSRMGAGPSRKRANQESAGP